MNVWSNLIAQAALLGQGGTAPQGGGGAGDLFIFLLPLIGAVIVFQYMMWRSQKRDRQQHEEMINTLQRNDRVQTVGGLLGTVVEVRDQEVVVKIDETNNVRARFTRDAIKTVLNKAGAGEK